MHALRIALTVIGSVALVYLGIALFERIAPRRAVAFYQKHLANPWFRSIAGVVPGWAVIETTGRRSGLPRRVPVGGRLRRGQYWLVVGDATASQYLRNIVAHPEVRVRVHGRWRRGTAHVMSGDDARKRLLRLNPVNGLFVALAGKDLLTVRIDLEPLE